MGQYYNIVNITKKEVIIPRDYDNGLKLMEFSWEGNSVIKALEHKLATDWKGDEVYVCGDYADEDYYETSYNEGYKHIILDVDELPKYRYLVNNENHTYINLENIPVTDRYGDIEYKVAPLSLLLALGNGRGGGDYWETNNGYEYVGSWSKSTKSISVQNEEPPENYTEFKPDFAEK